MDEEWVVIYTSEIGIIIVAVQHWLRGLIGDWMRDRLREESGDDQPQ